MQRKNTKLDFSGQEIYVGTDSGKKLEGVHFDKEPFLNFMAHFFSLSCQIKQFPLPP